MGVDGIMTDFPTRLAKVLKEKNLEWKNWNFWLVINYFQINYFFLSHFLFVVSTFLVDGQSQKMQHISLINIPLILAFGKSENSFLYTHVFYENFSRVQKTFGYVATLLRIKNGCCKTFVHPPSKAIASAHPKSRAMDVPFLASPSCSTLAMVIRMGELVFPMAVPLFIFFSIQFG